MSFWFDWWLLLINGILIIAVVKLLPRVKINLNVYNQEWVKRLLYVFSLIVFYIISIGMLCGFTRGAQNEGVAIGPGWLGAINDAVFGIMQWLYAPYYEAHPEATSTEFMFSSGQEWLRSAANIDFNNLQELATSPLHLFMGVLILTLYPYLLHVGIQLGELLFGSKAGKKGMFPIGWAFFMLIMMIIVPIISYWSLQNSRFNVGSVIIVEIICIPLLFICDFLLIQRKKEVL
jgi:hypothetical protein